MRMRTPQSTTIFINFIEQRGRVKTHSHSIGGIVSINEA